MTHAVEEALVRRYRKFIEKTARDYFRSFEWTRIDFEDIVSEATLGFLNAVRKIGVTKPCLTTKQAGKISLAIRFYLRMYIWEYVGATRNGHEDISSYGTMLYDDFPVSECEDGEEIPFEIPYEEDFTHPEFAELLYMLTTTDREMLEMKMSGLSMKEVSQKLGLSRSRCYERMRNIRKKARKFYPQSGGDTA